MSNITTQTTESQPERDIYIWDTSNPKSVINLVPERVREAMQKALEKCPELFRLDERKLSRWLRANEFTPTPTDHRLRLHFWYEYDLVHATNAMKMNITKIVAGVCSSEYFHKYYLTEQYKVAWLLCPPVDYIIRTTEALLFGLDELRDVLDLPSVDRNGKIDHKTIEAKIKIFKLLDDRIKGAAVQRIETKGQIQVATQSERTAVSAMVDAMREESIDRELKELARQEKKYGVIDVSPEVLGPVEGDPKDVK